ncbi:enterobactin exporter EntS [Streptococcus gordonii]|uniref:MFS transporter n=1 Tax=Streptococcus gordonii TaxID=1302 RepID=UPI000F6919BC|nr:MFS transporter [Streptococcus gordonii]MCY7168873.1 MFS transporter [Streptococcus gordonii]RSJ54097.1 enterobactin exporter EntS [Streptococcus gordonii]
MEELISDFASNKQIAKASISNFIGSLSGKSFNFALSLMLLDQTRSAISFGINMIIYPIISLLFAIPIGNMVDKYKHKNILINNFIFRIVIFLIFYFLYHITTSSTILYFVIPLVVLQSITVNINDTCFSASTHELVNNRKIQRLSSITQTGIAIATMISPAIGVMLYGWFDFSGFILIESAANLLSLLVLLNMKFYYEQQENNEATIKSKGRQHKFKEILQFLRENQIIKYIILISIILNFFYTSISIGVPFIVKEELSLGNSTIGLLETVSAIGMLLASVSMSLLPEPKRQNQLLSRRITIPFLLLNISIISLGITFFVAKSRFLISSVGSLFIGLITFSLVILNIVVMTYLQSTIETKFLGRVMSTLFTLNTSIMPIGTIVFTYLFQQGINGGLIFIVNGLVLLIYTIIMLPKTLKLLNK